MARAVFYVLFLLVILSLVLLAAEIGLRQKGIYQTYSERSTGEFATDWGLETPDLLHTWGSPRTFLMERDEFSYNYSINSIGFREREVPVDSDGSLKVFVFGDSFAEGTGAPYDSTFTQSLERILVRNHEEANVYNFGVSGADPFYNYVVLENAIGMQPTHVVFIVNESDIYDYSVRGGFERYERKEGVVKYKDPPPMYGLYRKSHLARYIFLEWLDYDHNLIRNKDWPEIELEAVAAIKDCFDRAAYLCYQNNVEYVIITHPFPASICGSTDYGASGMKIDAFNELFNRTVHISHPMAEVMKADCPSYYWEADGHFNSKGYQLMAETFYKEVYRNDKEFWDR